MIRTLCYYILDLTQCTKSYDLFHLICPLSRCLYAMLPKQATGLLTYKIGVVVLPGPQISTRATASERSSCGGESTILLHMQNSVRQVIGQIPPYIFADASLVIDVTYLCCMRVCVVRSSQIIRKRAHSTDSIVCTFAYSSSLRSSTGTSMGIQLSIAPLHYWRFPV